MICLCFFAYLTCALGLCCHCVVDFHCCTEHQKYKHKVEVPEIVVSQFELLYCILKPLKTLWPKIIIQDTKPVEKL